MENRRAFGLQEGLDVTPEHGRREYENTLTARHHPHQQPFISTRVLLSG